MEYRQYDNATDFLNRMQPLLERSEAVNGLMLGLCLRLVDNLFYYGSQPLFGTVESCKGNQLAVLMTPPHKLQIYAKERPQPDSVEVLVQGVSDNGWHVPAVMAETDVAEVFAAVWTQSGDCTADPGMRLRIHELREVAKISYADGDFRQAEERDIDLIQSWIRAFSRDAFADSVTDIPVANITERVKAGHFFLWMDKVIVSLAARSRPTPHGEAVSYVYTPPEQRRKGYATALVAALSQKILDDGKGFCTLYTDLNNPTSNSIYRKIGYMPVADVIDIDFDYIHDL